MSQSLVRRTSPAGDVSLAPLEGIVSLSETSLTVTDPDLPSEDWLRLVVMLARARSGASWWLGDALAYGEERKYGKTYAIAAEETGLSVRTLRNLASVSRRVSPSRRVHSLPWRAHRAIAHLRASEQRRWLKLAREHEWKSDELAAIVGAVSHLSAEEQTRWLGRAAEFGWSSQELAHQMELAGASAEKGPKSPPKPRRHVDYRCPKCHYGWTGSALPPGGDTGHPDDWGHPASWGEDL